MEIVIPEGYRKVARGKIHAGDERFDRNVFCFVIVDADEVGEPVGDATVIRKADDEQ